MTQARKVWRDKMGVFVKIGDAKARPIATEFCRGADYNHSPAFNIVDNAASTKLGHKSRLMAREVDGMPALRVWADDGYFEHWPIHYPI